MFNARTFKVLLAVMVVMILAGAAYAFAAANTVPATKAGDGSGTISGYTISNVVYTLNTADPSLMDSVKFDLSAAAITVKINLVSTGSTWYDCTNGGAGNTWTCDTTGGGGATVVSMDQLRVVATDH